MVPQRESRTPKQRLGIPAHRHLLGCPPCFRTPIFNSNLIKNYSPCPLVPISQPSNPYPPNPAILPRLHPSTRSLRRNLVAFLLLIRKPLLLSGDRSSFETNIEGACTEDGYEREGTGMTVGRRGYISSFLNMAGRVGTVEK